MPGRDYTQEPWGTGREAVIGALVGVAAAIAAALWVGGQSPAWSPGTAGRVAPCCPGSAPSVGLPNRTGRGAR